MIVFSGFRQYKCKLEKPLRWMSLQNAYVLSARNFITYIFFSLMAPNSGYMLCKWWKSQFSFNTLCILNVFWVWLRYDLYMIYVWFRYVFWIFWYILWICLRYGLDLDSLWYFMVSYDTFWYVMIFYRCMIMFSGFRQYNVKLKSLCAGCPWKMHMLSARTL